MFVPPSIAGAFAISPIPPCENGLNRFFECWGISRKVLRCGCVQPVGRGTSGKEQR